MPFATGVVTKIGSFELEEPDRQGNKFLMSFRLDSTPDVRFDLKWAQPVREIGIRKGKDSPRVVLKEGDTVEFMYKVDEYNGKTTNKLNPSDITITASGDSVVQDAPTPSNGKTATSQPSFKSDGIKGVKTGHAISNGIVLATSRYGNAVTAQQITEAAEEVLRISKDIEERFDSILAETPDVPQEPAPKKVASKPKAKTQPKAEPVQEEPAVEDNDNFEDDMPF